MKTLKLSDMDYNSTYKKSLQEDEKELEELQTLLKINNYDI